MSDQHQGHREDPRNHPDVFVWTESHYDIDPELTRKLHEDYP